MGLSIIGALGVETVSVFALDAFIEDGLSLVRRTKLHSTEDPGLGFRFGVWDP